MPPPAMRDAAPDITPAGRVWAQPDESASQALKAQSPPPTPPEQGRFRLSHRGQPGRPVRHPGAALDPPPRPDGFAYGKKVQYAGSAQDCLQRPPVSRVMQSAIDHAESIYQSSRLEPLARSVQRGHKLPEKTKDPAFAFGVPTVSSESAKEVLYRERDDDDDDIKHRYKKSHGAYDPGEQKTRDYKWETARIDPINHTFGVALPPEHDGVKKTLFWDGGDEECGKTKRIVKKTTDDFHTYHKDELGKPRRLHARPEEGYDPNRSFGVATKAKNATAGELINGLYKEKEQEPDPNLGKSNRPGYRNVTEDPTKTFGVPTIRTDVQKRKVKSVADNQNYGDEPDASGVIYPTRFSERGLFEDDFRQSIPKDQLWELVRDAQIAITTDEFEEVYTQAAEESHMNYVTMESFMRNLTQLRMKRASF